MIEEYISANLQNYISLVSLISGFSFGDILILLAMLAGAGKAKISVIFAFAFLGGLVHDLLFFAIAKSDIFKKIAEPIIQKKKKTKILQFILSTTKKNMFFTLLIAKFIYGVRDITILYYAHNSKTLRKYLMNALSAEFLWLSAILSIGWLAGRGFTEILKIFKGLEKLLLIAVLFLIVSLVLRKLISKIFDKIFSIKLRRVLS
jgi:membrane protein DedA with SNARE-associated domain